MYNKTIIEIIKQLSRAEGECDNTYQDFDNLNINNLDYSTYIRKTSSNNCFTLLFITYR